MRARRAATRQLEQGPQPLRGLEIRRDRNQDPERALRQEMRLHAELKPMSSYPDVLPLLIEPDADVSPEESRNLSRHAIVSIDGKDVDDKMLAERKIA